MTEPTQTSAQLPILTRSEWRRQVLIAPARGVDERIARREEERYRLASGMAEIACHGPDNQPMHCSASVLNISRAGIMAKTRTPIPENTLAIIRLRFDEQVCTVAARVCHETLTAGGYKIGFELIFADDDIDATAK